MYRRAPRPAANSDFFAAAVRRALPGGTAYDELRRVFDFIHEGSGDARRRALCDDHIHRRLAAGAKMMVNGGEARRGDAGRKNVVEATHRKITRYAQTLGCKLAQNAERRHIIHADEGCGHALTPDQLRRELPPNRIFVGQAVILAVCLGLAVGHQHLQSIRHTVQLQLLADSLQALLTRQCQLVERRGDEHQLAVAQLIQMLGQHGACVHVAQLDGADGQVVQLFPDDDRGCGRGDLLHQAREAGQKSIDDTVHMRADKSVEGF